MIERQILAVKCPVLNHAVDSVKEVLLEIEYGTHDVKPKRIICPEYDSALGHCTYKDNKENRRCIYSNGFQTLK